MLLFAAGLACGAAAGVLLAPDKGGNTRRTITDKGRKLSSSLSGMYGDVKKKYDDVKKKFTDESNGNGQASRGKNPSMKNAE